MIQDSRGNIWLGSNDEGLQKISPEGNKLYTLEDGLPNSSIRALAEDKDGNIWIGTAGGVVYLTPDGKLFTPQFAPGTTASGVITSHIFCDNVGRIWLTISNENGFFLFTNGVFRPLLEFEKFGRYFATAIYQDRDEVFWIGLGDKGLCRLENGVANLTIDASTVGALPTGTTLDNVADGTTRKLSDYLPLSGGTITGAITFPTASTATDNTKGINFSNGSSVVAHVGTSTLLGFYSSGKIYLRPNGATSSAAGNGSIEVANDGVNVFEKITAEGFIKSGGTATQFLKADGSVDSTTYATNAALTAHTADTTVHVTSSDKTTWNGKQDAFSNASVLSGITSQKVTNWDGAATNSHTHSNKTVLDGITSAKVTQWDNAISGVSLNGTAATVTNHVAALTGVATTANVSTHSGTTIPSATSSQMHLPAVTAADNGKILMVVNGQWALVNPTTIYTGSGTPSSGQGNDGDIYLQTS